MKRLFEKCYIALCYLRFLPHIIFFLVCKRKESIIFDLKVYKEEYKLKGGNVHLLIQLLAHNISFRSLFYYRIGNIKWLFKWLGDGATELRIPLTAKIGGGLMLFHAYGTIFSSMCSIGEMCRVVHNVTIGDKNGRAPTIGNNVEILPNAVVVGDITIGDNCVIGPGAVVFKSVPANCVVVGNPAYILKKDGVIVNQKL